VGVGQSWTSGDGHARFDVAAIEFGQVKIVANAGDPSSEAVPNVINVKPGDNFQISATTGPPLEVVVTQIDGLDSITVDIWR
jgi:hypothetical protein